MEVLPFIRASEEMTVSQIVRESGPWHCPMSRPLFPPAFVSQTNECKCIRPQISPEQCTREGGVGFSPTMVPSARAKPKQLCPAAAAINQEIGNLATKPSSGRDIFAVVRSLPRKPRMQSAVQALTKVLEPRPNQAERVNRRSEAPGKRSP